MHTSNFSRLHFAHLPTPLEPMQNISKALGGPNLWIKRDDCTGLSSGGNKTRKLEFIMADAVDEKADTIVTGCAYCLQMLDDSVKIMNKEELIVLKRCVFKLPKLSIQRV